jgi:hypothetical protein
MSRRHFARTRRARCLPLAALTALIPLAAGCGSSSSSSSSSSSTSAGGVALVNTPPANAKLPPRLTVVLSSTGAVSLKNAQGQPVTELSSGRYTLSISVESKHGDFRLTGPMIDRRTRPHFSGVVLWGVHLVKGTYRYLNDESGSHPTVHVINVS